MVFFFFPKIDSNEMQPTVVLNSLHPNQIAKYFVHQADRETDKTSSRMISESTHSKTASAAMIHEEIIKAKKISSQKSKMLKQSPRRLRNRNK